MTVLRYGGDEAFPPFEYRGADGGARGFQVELARLLGSVAGLDVEIRLGPWAEVEAAFRAGALDVVAMVPTAERRQWAQFTRSHATPAFGVYHRRGTPPPQSLQDLAGRVVAVLDGAPMRETRASVLAASGLQYLPVATAADALAAVADGRAQAALVLHALAEPVRRDGGAPGVLAADFSPRLQSYAFALAPGAGALRDRLDAALATLEADGRLEALRERWLSSHVELALRHRLAAQLGVSQAALWSLGAGSLAVVAGLGVVVRRRGRRVAEEAARRQASEARLASAQAMLEHAFTRHPEPMFVVEDGGGAVRDVNEAMCRLVGQPAEAVLGQPLAALSQHVEAAALDALGRVLRRDGGIVALPVIVRRADAAQRHCLVSAEPIRIDGRAHVFVLLRDVTQERERDEALCRGYDALVAELKVMRQAAERSEAVAAELQQQSVAVAHDLKAPLRAVRGFNGLLQGTLAAGRIDEALAHSQQIDRAARRMESLVAGLGRLAAEGSRPLARGHVDMHTLAVETWDRLVAGAPERRVAFALAVLPSAEAEADGAAQVWQNLLENAWKYTARQPEAKVAVDAFRTGERQWYRITDNGAGFDMANAERLFQPFQRMHAASEFEGTGVGLSLVRRILQRHGGDIRVRSAKGVGTVVEFSFDAG